MEESGDEQASLDLLGVRLYEAGIDTSSWGKGAAKTLNHLWRELEKGEAFLEPDKDGQLLRKVIVSGADVFYSSSDGRRYRLKEDRQVFTDGRVRRRDLGFAVSEKLGLGEEPEEGMVRGIREELGIEGDVSLKQVAADEQTRESRSYPGLRSQYTRYLFRVQLNSDQFRPEGYIEKQPDKTTYFVWEQIENQ